MASGTFAHTVTVDIEPDDVWGALQRAETWAGIGPIDEVWDAEHAADGSLRSYRWRADAAGRRWEGTAVTSDADPPDTMSMALETAEMRGTITVAVEGRGPAAVTVTLEAEATGMLAALFWGVISAAISRGLPQQVEEFAARL
jgi:carbon monoxide dehydrogenase subunit G